MGGGGLPCVQRRRYRTRLPHSTLHSVPPPGRGLWSRVGLGAGPGADAVPVTRFGPCAGVRWAGLPACCYTTQR